MGTLRPAFCLVSPRGQAGVLPSGFFLLPRWPWTPRRGCIGPAASLLCWASGLVSLSQPPPAWLLWRRPRGPLSFLVSRCSFCPPAGSPSSSCPSRVGFRGLLPWCPSRAASLPKPVRWEHLPRPLGACCLSHTPHALRPPHPLPTLLCHLDHGHSLD